MKLELKKFDMQIIPVGSVIVMIGRRGFGKTSIIREYIRLNKDIPAGIVISPTERSNQFFEKFIPRMLIYDEYDPKILDKFVKRQMRITEQYKNEIKIYGKSDLDPRSFIILDDCMYDKSWVNDINIRYLFCNGRHINATVIIALQFAMGIPPMFRTNIDFVFLLKENIVKNRQRLYEHYAGMFPTFEVFCQVMDQCTENYECLVINNKTLSNKIPDQVFWYKVDNFGIEFRSCSRKWWDMLAADEHRRALGIGEPVDEEEDYDPSIMKSKKGPPIVVRKTGY